MTQEQLNKANTIHGEICHTKDRINSIKKTQREIELDNFMPNEVNVKMQNSSCLVTRKDLIEFLNTQLEKEEALLLSLEKNFKEI